MCNVAVGEDTASGDVAEDGIVDALFRFTRPLSGAYFWCPPVKSGKLDLGAIGL